ncbi:MAG: hypothetical protein WDZ94_05430 [Patescibacteria group bacterium]
MYNTSTGQVLDSSTLAIGGVMSVPDTGQFVVVHVLSYAAVDQFRSLLHFVRRSS